MEEERRIGRPPKPLDVYSFCGCWMQRSHKLNKDSYLRIRRPSSEEGVSSSGHIMMYRLMWQHEHNKVIPKGHEIDHLCKNRGCFNPKHLSLVESVDHTISSNKERYPYGKTRRIKE